MLWPLPVTPFEYYYLSDDRAQYPTVFPVRLEFDRPLDAALLERAWSLCIDRHPLLAARLNRHGLRWPQWTNAAPPAIEWNALPAPGQAALDIGQHTLRLWYQSQGERSTLQLMFHHACVDGLAGLQVAEDLLTAYHHLASGHEGPPPWRNLDPQRLQRRAEYGLADYKPRLIDLVNTGRTWAPLLLRRPAVLATQRAAPTSVPTDPTSYAQHWLTPEATRQLARRAKASAATVNDLLLRDLFLTLHDWNSRLAGKYRRPLRILVPTNLRLPDDMAMPAANVLSFAFLTRRAAALADEQALLTSIRDETAAIKRWRLSLYFVGGLGVASNLPGVMPWILRRRWPFATAVFTNLGPIFSQAPLERVDDKLQVGPALLQSVTGTAPLRPETRIAVNALTYAGRLGFFVRCDPQWFDSTEQRQFLDALLARIERTIDDSAVRSLDHEAARISGST